MTARLAILLVLLAFPAAAGPPGDAPGSGLWAVAVVAAALVTAALGAAAVWLLKPAPEAPGVSSLDGLSTRRGVITNARPNQ